MIMDPALSGKCLSNASFGPSGGPSGPTLGALDTNVVRLVQDLLSRPSKRLRAKLVAAGYEMALDGEGARDDALVEAMCDLLEALHGGSLVVDDIQDGSLERRGQPSLHQKYGTPLALNAGNWMYFWPLYRVQALGLEPMKELAIYRLCHEVLWKAHCGQALDIGVRVHQVDQASVAELSNSCLNLKSGALAGLGLGLGAIAANAPASRISELVALGESYGVLLQRFDDVGNVQAKHDPSKKMEDVFAMRPSWVWSIASQMLDADQWEEMKDLASRRAPEMERFLARLGVVEIAWRECVQGLQEFEALVDTKCGNEKGSLALKALAQALKGAYK